MERARIFRFLRYAVTVFSLTACVLLIVLWVRSYWWEERVRFAVTESQNLDVYHAQGRVHFNSWADDDIFGGPNDAFSWTFTSRLVNQAINAKLPKTTLGFRVDITKFDWLVILPYWFLILLSVAVPGCPWLPWLRYRFSLRTLLIATTLIAVTFGVVIYLAR